MKKIRHDSNQIILEEKSILPYFAPVIFIIGLLLLVVTLISGKEVRNEIYIVIGVLLFLGISLLFSPITTTINIDTTSRAISKNKKKLFLSPKTISEDFDNIKELVMRLETHRDSDSSSGKVTYRTDYILSFFTHNNGEWIIDKVTMDRGGLSFGDPGTSPLFELAHQISEMTKIPFRDETSRGDTTIEAVQRVVVDIMNQKNNE